MAKGVKRYRAQDNKLMQILCVNDSTTKYGNKWVIIDGIKFQSIREGGYYQYLKAEKTAGRVIKFELQVVYPVVINGVKVCSYIADFLVTYTNGQTVVIDVKGFKTDIYKLKKKLIKAVYGIDIVEK